jgi:hypothetical protein
MEENIIDYEQLTQEIREMVVNGAIFLSPN